MYGIYLECEACKATIGGEEVTPSQQGMPTLDRHDGRILRQKASERGWKYLGGDQDYCPECMPSNKVI